jgi:hypothetical protein
LNETGTIYKTGDFYLTVAYSPANSNLSIGINKNHNEKLLNMTTFRRKRSAEEQALKLKSFNWVSDTNQLISDDDINRIKKLNKTIMSLNDVTEYIFDKNSTDILTQMYLTVCQRTPKIRIICINHETVRVRLCELKYEEKRRSYCYSLLNECYSINEYEYDEYLPTQFIRVCKYRDEEDYAKSLDFHAKLNSAKKSDEILNKISGFVSVVSIVISLFFLVATFTTYLLFKVLRNIPAWNVINLTAALIIAQSSFLIGSFVKEIKVFCFIEALLAHYGFLAAFFWMNVIAFDLHRNFKSSHVILNTISLKERLPKYMVYAWLSPFLIVLASLSIDLAVKISIQDTFFRPCYAGKLCLFEYFIYFLYFMKYQKS